MTAQINHPYALKWRSEGRRMVCYLAPTGESDPTSAWTPILMVSKDVLDLDPNDKKDRDFSIYTELGESIQKWYLRCAGEYGNDPRAWPVYIVPGTIAEDVT